MLCGLLLLKPDLFFLNESEQNMRWFSSFQQETNKCVVDEETEISNGNQFYFNGVRISILFFLLPFF